MFYIINTYEICYKSLGKLENTFKKMMPLEKKRKKSNPCRVPNCFSQRWNTKLHSALWRQWSKSKKNQTEMRSLYSFRADRCPDDVKRSSSAKPRLFPLYIFIAAPSILDRLYHDTNSALGVEREKERMEEDSRNERGDRKRGFEE